jgi:hypothetical protein
MSYIYVGSLVSVTFGKFVLVAKGEVLQLPVWNNDLWVVKDLETGEILQPSASRATITKLI